jgi:L-threonylcarbamoyladenylate synthase
MLIIYPTETCYGIGCSIFDTEGIKKIYELKKREKNKSLIVLVNSIKMWKKIAKVSKVAQNLAMKYWPGPLTIIQPKKSKVSNLICDEEIGVRWSSHLVPNQLINELNAPIISTSANISGEKNPYSISEISNSIKENVDKIIDKGNLKTNPPSTVINIKNDKIKIIRKGNIKL